MSSALDRRLQNEAVHHGGEHAHRIADGSRHTARGHLHPAEDVAAADHYPEFDPELRRSDEIGRDALDDALIDTERALPAKRLTRKLDDHAAIKGIGHC